MTIDRVMVNHLQSCKEVARHALFRFGLFGVLKRLREHRGYASSHLEGDSAEETFRRIYREGVWVHGHGQKSRSGLGSEATATTGLLDALSSVIRELGCHSVVDVGCGDWNWMQRGALRFKYTGVDIVPEIIESNKKFESQNVVFQVCNVIESPPPVADFALCREVLFHLSFNDAKSAIDNIKGAARYFCATTDLDIWFNSDIPTGDFRMLNLLRAPFRFPTPLYLIPDVGMSPGRRLGVWDCMQLP